MKSNNHMTLLIEAVVCLFLILLLSTVDIADIYAVYLRELSLFRFSTHSVFLIGNLIIILIVMQSTKLVDKSSTPARKVHFDIADQKMKPRPDQVQSFLNAGDLYNPQAKNSTPTREVRSRSVSEQSIEKDVSVKKEIRSQLYRRTMSASYERGGAKVNTTVSKPELLRSKTVRLGRGEASSTLMAGRFEELNHDEFRRKIESFIQKQRRLIREELVVAGSGEHGFRIKR